MTDKNEFHARIGTPSDYAAVLDIQYRSYRLKEAPLYGPNIPPLAETPETLSREIAEGKTLLVGERGGTIVASLRMKRLPDGAAYFGRLSVDPDLQGRGIGQKMVAAFERRNADAPAFVLDCGVDSAENYHIYSKLGYIETGEALQVPNGPKCVVMRKDNLRTERKTNMIQGDGFEYDLLYKGSAFSMLKVALPSGGSIKAESGAMVAMDDTINVEGKSEGGILGGLARKLLTSESFFFQTLTAARGPGEVLLSPSILGDITVLELDGSRTYQLQKGGFFAASPGVEVATKMQNLSKGLLSGEGFFVQQVSGRGTLFVESFGAVHILDIPAGKSMVVDNYHLVAWDADTSYTLEKASSGWLSSLTSGEGLVCRFQGPGRVYIQTRNPPGFAGWLSGMISK